MWVHAKVRGTYSNMLNQMIFEAMMSGFYFSLYFSVFFNFSIMYTSLLYNEKNYFLVRSNYMLVLSE